MKNPTGSIPCMAYIYLRLPLIQINHMHILPRQDTWRTFLRCAIYTPFFGGKKKHPNKWLSTTTPSWAWAICWYKTLDFCTVFGDFMTFQFFFGMHHGKLLRAKKKTGQIKQNLWIDGATPDCVPFRVRSIWVQDRQGMLCIFMQESGVWRNIRVKNKIYGGFPWSVHFGRQRILWHVHAREGEK